MAAIIKTNGTMKGTTVVDEWTGFDYTPFIKDVKVEGQQVDIVLVNAPINLDIERIKIEFTGEMSKDRPDSFERGQRTPYTIEDLPLLVQRRDQIANLLRAEMRKAPKAEEEPKELEEEPALPDAENLIEILQAYNTMIKALEKRNHA